MNPAWSVLNGDVLFTQEIKPPTLLAYRFRGLHKICQSGMVCPDDYGSSKQVLPILYETKNHTEEFTTGDTVSSLSWCQGSTGIAYDM